MKLQHIALALGLTAFSMSAMAAETLTINGKVIDSTCSIELLGGGLTLTLDPVEANKFTGLNSELGKQGFKFRMDNCGVRNQIRVKFLDGTTVGSGGNLVNTLGTAAGAAQNVAIRLYNADDNAINVKTDSGNPLLLGSRFNVPGVAGSYEIPYSASYIQNNANKVTAGDVKATVQFEADYL